MTDKALEAQAEQWRDDLFGKLRLKPITCPACQTLFGMTTDDVQFAEQTDEPVWCPRGHRLRMRASLAPSGDGEAP